MRVYSLSYWLIGLGNAASPFVMALDRLSETGDLIRVTEHDEPETYAIKTRDAKAAPMEARVKALAIAMTLRIPAERVFYDTDSTACFADC